MILCSEFKQFILKKVIQKDYAKKWAAEAAQSHKEE